MPGALIVTVTILLLYLFGHQLFIRSPGAGIEK
jgi:hypothetical protein